MTICDIFWNQPYFGFWHDINELQLEITCSNYSWGGLNTPKIIEQSLLWMRGGVLVGNYFEFVEFRGAYLFWLFQPLWNKFIIFRGVPLTPQPREGTYIRGETNVLYENLTLHLDWLKQRWKHLGRPGVGRFFVECSGIWAIASFSRHRSPHMDSNPTRGALGSSKINPLEGGFIRICGCHSRRFWRDQRNVSLAPDFLKGIGDHKAWAQLECCNRTRDQDILRQTKVLLRSFKVY